MTYWELGKRDSLWDAVTAWTSSGFLPDPTGLALLWMDCEWSCDARTQRFLDPIMARQERISLIGPAMRPQHRLEAEAGCVVELRPAGCTRWRYHKLTWLLDEIEAQLDEGFSAFTALNTIENFGKLGTIQWLKVAGDTKAYIIESSFMQRHLGDADVHIEFGCYVGYTATRLGQLQHRVGRQTASVFSLERDAVHAAVARHVLDLSKLRTIAEVHCGLVPLVTPRVLEEAGGSGVGFLFMDHRGTRFHRELAHLERLGVLAAFGCATVDNCLIPGSPEFCWSLTNSHGNAARSWSLHEFDRSFEDWMIVCDMKDRKSVV